MFCNNAIASCKHVLVWFWQFYLLFCLVCGSMLSVSENQWVIAYTAIIVVDIGHLSVDSVYNLYMLKFPWCKASLVIHTCHSSDQCINCSPQYQQHRARRGRQASCSVWRWRPPQQSLWVGAQQRSGETWQSAPHGQSPWCAGSGSCSCALTGNQCPGWCTHLNYKKNCEQMGWTVQLTFVKLIKSKQNQLSNKIR